MHASLYSRAAEESALVLTSTKFQEEGTVRSNMEDKCYDRRKNVAPLCTNFDPAGVAAKLKIMLKLFSGDSANAVPH